MKNIHVLPTNKPSRLYKEEGIYKLDNLVYGAGNQNIYITSDEEIKEGDWLIDDKYKQLMKYFGEGSLLISSKKIILTTDQDLIKDGVQDVDDNFLEWFVKNQSCEYIEIENVYDKFLNSGKRSVSDFRKKYKIIIPKGEPKQDWYCPKCDSYVSAESVTFEETHQICNTSVIDKEEPKQCDICKMYPRLEGTNKCESCYSVIRHFLEQNPKFKGKLLPDLRKKQETLEEVAEGQAEKMYSEEEAVNILIKAYEDIGKRKIPNQVVLASWFLK